MNSLGNNTNNQKRTSQGQQNPFAKALAEVEQKGSQKRSYQQQTAEKQANNQSSNQEKSIFDANSSSQQGEQTVNSNNLSHSKAFQEYQARQAEEKAKEAKRQQLREKLHRKVNPVEQSAVFDAREQQTKARINEIRKELKKLAESIADFYKEVDVTLSQDINATGLTGIYHENFLDKLKQFIIMLRQKVNSAKTWARQAKRKSKKKKAKHGLDFANNEAKAAHDTFHHERSSSYGA